jgi:hypothetical protein
VATVVVDGEIALNEVAKLRLKVDGTRLLVAEELRLDGEPGVSNSGALGGDDFSDVIGERADDPGLDEQSIRAQSGETGTGGA